jgi:hypothetical protein
LLKGAENFSCTHDVLRNVLSRSDANEAPRVDNIIASRGTVYLGSSATPGNLLETDDITSTKFGREYYRLRDVGHYQENGNYMYPPK